jgi:hypothetical protein
MKNLVLVLGLCLAAVPALAKPLCRPNRADKNIKTVCYLGEKQTDGFLLYNANGTKSYLVVTRRTLSGYGEQEYGRRVWTFTVKKADSKLNPLSNEISQLRQITTWEYSDGGTVLTGTTPGGRKIDILVESGDSV